MIYHHSAMLHSTIFLSCIMAVSITYLLITLFCAFQNKTLIGCCLLFFFPSFFSLATVTILCSNIIIIYTNHTSESLDLYFVMFFLVLPEKHAWFVSKKKKEKHAWTNFYTRHIKIVNKYVGVIFLLLEL